MNESHSTAKEKKDSWISKIRSFFGDKDRGLRLVVGLICMVCIALFLHFHEVKVELLELHSVSGSYVVAQVDFEFPDDQRTIILKQSALADIGPIYRLKGKNLRDIRFDFENHLIQNPDWRQFTPAVTYERMYKIADALETILGDIRFAEPKAIKRMKKYELATTNYLPYAKPSSDSDDTITLPSEYWTHLKETSFKTELEDKYPDASREAIAFVIKYFENGQLILVEDLDTEGAIQQLVEKHVPQQFAQVKAGTRIIGPGEKVTARHVAIIEAMKKNLEEGRDLFSIYKMAGNLLIALLFVVLSALYFRIEQPRLFYSVQRISLLVCIVILTLAFAKITEYIVLENPTHLMQSIRYPLFIPFAAILITILLNLRVALFASFFLAILLSLGLAVEHSHFLIVNLVAGLATILSSKRLRKRSEVFVVCAKCFLAVVPIIFAFSLAAGHLWSKSINADFGSALLFIAITAILTVGLLPILESFFNVLTDMTLMEYTDPNNELLRRMTLEIPGTYHHSLVLGNIAEAAAQSIGANALLCRVATLYHDIGKLQNSHYFSENQPSSVNIHQLLSPEESAKVIISHVKAGESIARKNHLPQAIIDVITQHHGTTLVYYFYCKEIELKEGHEEDVDQSKFRYPGPKPQTKESAIIMVADAIEAASRSMEDITEEGLRNKIADVIHSKADDGQFNECDLTFKDIETMKNTIASTLLASRHVRIKYPEKKENGHSH